MDESTGRQADFGIWNYRVVQWKTPQGKPYFSIHEVYYDDEGRPISCSVEPDHPMGNTLDELREDLEWYRKAIDAPVLTEDDFTGDWGLDLDSLADLDPNKI